MIFINQDNMGSGYDSYDLIDRCLSDYLTTSLFAQYGNFILAYEAFRVLGFLPYPRSVRYRLLTMQ